MQFFNAYILKLRILIKAGWCLFASVKLDQDNGLSPVQHQVIIWTNADIMSITFYRTYFDKILFEIQKFLFQ